MEDHKTNEFPRPAETPEWAQDALAPKKPPFSANRKEQLLAFGMYVLAYLYLGYQWWALPAFAVCFVAAAEYLFRDVKRPWESWVWLGCMLIAAGCIAWRGLHPYQYDSRYPEIVNHEYILSDKLLLLILHAFSVYWLMSRSGRLTGGESGHLLPLDALYAFVIIPFKNFFLRIRCVLFALKPQKERKLNAGTAAAAVLAAFVVLVLFAMAMTQLSAADDTFSRLLDGLRDALTFDLDQEWFFRFLLSLPVGACLRPARGPWPRKAGGHAAARRICRGRAAETAHCAGGRLARGSGRVQRALSRVLFRAGPVSVRRVYPDAARKLYRCGVCPSRLL